jgi:hypothetical protein
LYVDSRGKLIRSNAERNDRTDPQMKIPLCRSRYGSGERNGNDDYQTSGNFHGEWVVVCALVPRCEGVTYLYSSALSFKALQ